jgi:hypothetical protein
VLPVPTEFVAGGKGVPSEDVFKALSGFAAAIAEKHEANGFN